MPFMDIRSTTFPFQPNINPVFHTIVRFNTDATTESHKKVNILRTYFSTVKKYLILRGGFTIKLAPLWSMKLSKALETESIDVLSNKHVLTKRRRCLNDMSMFKS